MVELGELVIFVHPTFVIFRDVHDHLQRASGRTTALRELLTSTLQANLTQVSVRQNEDMRMISAWVAILAVPTMIAGIYGMNFDHKQMPTSTRTGPRTPTPRSIASTCSTHPCLRSRLMAPHPAGDDVRV